MQGGVATARDRVRAVLLLLLCAGLAGCAAVAPWERGRLAKPHMAIEPMPAQGALREHTYLSREAATSTRAGKGGGCGCY